MKRKFTKGEMYRPGVHVLKVKKGIPTVLKISGKRYVLEHKDQFEGGKEMKKRTVQISVKTLAVLIHMELMEKGVYNADEIYEIFAENNGNITLVESDDVVFNEMLAVDDND